MVRALAVTIRPDFDCNPTGFEPKSKSDQIPLRFLSEFTSLTPSTVVLVSEFFISANRNPTGVGHNSADNRSRPNCTLRPAELRSAPTGLMVNTRPKIASPMPQPRSAGEANSDRMPIVIRPATGPDPIGLRSASTMLRTRATGVRRSRARRWQSKFRSTLAAIRPTTDPDPTRHGVRPDRDWLKGRIAACATVPRMRAPDVRRSQTVAHELHRVNRADIFIKTTKQLAIKIIIINK